MDRDQVIEMIAEGIDRFCEDVEEKNVPRDELFGVARRAIERGLHRIDDFGDSIVNEPTPQSEVDVKKQLGWFYSGPIQCAVAAGMMLRHLPDLPKGVTMDVATTDPKEPK